MADIEASSTQAPDSGSGNIIHLWKIPIDKNYVKSINGILKFVSAIISLIAFICVASGRSDNCDDDYSSTYNYFEFVSITTFITLMIFWFLYVLTLTSRLFFKIIPWTFGDMIYCAVFTVLYLIANIVLAAQSCGKDSNKAGCAFGFFTMFGIAANGGLLFREWYSSRKSSSSGKTSENYNAERNMEQY